jgi:hypothetical protein
VFLFKKKLGTLFFFCSLQGFFFCENTCAESRVQNLVWQLLKNQDWSQKFVESQSRMPEDLVQAATLFYCSNPEENQILGQAMSLKSEECPTNSQNIEPLSKLDTSVKKSLESENLPDTLKAFIHSPEKRQELFFQLLQSSLEGSLTD